jgi:cold shock CspA family protein
MPSGTVAEFDDVRGFGVVRDDETGEEHFFHRTAIADGSRTIEVGAAVQFEIVPGRNGTWEAKPVAPSSPAA